MVFSTLNQSFSFHSSPESFISARLQEFSTGDAAISPDANGIAQASILNRNVHIITSYKLCCHILDNSSPTDSSSVVATRLNEQVNPDTFAAGPAYQELMADFFPAPNILLEDGDLHQRHRKAWEEQTSALATDSEALIRNIAKSFIVKQMRSGTTVDLYDLLKALAWELLLGVFLGLDKVFDSNKFAEVENAQETLLRGQFSLFPVSLSTPIWQSARSRGLKARKALQMMLREHISGKDAVSCPVLRQKAVDKNDAASHCLLFTSSIANKALASLLTASIMNLFLMPSENSLADLVRAQVGEGKTELLNSILLETERLSPPVVGVMRRVQQDITVTGSSESLGHAIPKGHDVWMYFVGASRDPESFEDSDSFHFDRYMNHETPLGFAFGSGQKTCLGMHIVRRIVRILCHEMVEEGIQLQGDISDPGIRQWLGWDKMKDSQAFAKAMKQLPCQRPREPVAVKVLVTASGG